MFGLGVPELILILVIGFVIFGPNRIPDFARSLGKGIKEFKAATRNMEKEVQNALEVPQEKAS